MNQRRRSIPSSEMRDVSVWTPTKEAHRAEPLLAGGAVTL